MPIRDLTANDCDALVDLWREAGLPYKPGGRDARERLVREMAASRAVWLGAEEEGRLIGAVLGTHDGRKGWINRLAVLPDYRRHGIARALVAAAEERLGAMGIDIVACLVEDANAQSLAFFAQVGYATHRDIVYLTKRRGPEV